MPIQAPQWTDYLNCPICCREFGAPPRSPVSLNCGHTFCKHCIKHLHRKQCPFDQAVIQLEPNELVVNTALLQLAGFTPPSQPYHPPSILALSEQDRRAYDVIVRCMEHLAVYLKFCSTANNSMVGNRLSRPMQRKLVTLLQCPMIDEEGRGKAARAARSLGERTLTELLLQHQNPQQLSANLWAAVRARGCQFLGPAMQEEVLKLVLLALEDGSALSRKVLVMFVVQRLEPHFPQASKTSIGHVVQLLYRASCFKVSKRECNSSLMQLKEEFRTYESLRREHDAQIVQIATEAGLRIAPDQWSALLYGDTVHKSHMQSIIDKLQSPQSFAQSVQELYIALQRTGDPAQLVVMSLHLDRLANIDSSPDAKCPSWQKLAEIMTSLKDVVTGLVHYLQQQNTGRDANHNQKFNLEPSTSQTIQITTLPSHEKLENFDMPRCGDSVKRTRCPRGANCPLIHADDDLESYKVVLVEAGKMDQYQRLLNSSNGIPGMILRSDTPQNQSQGIPDLMPQGMPPQSLPQGIPQTLSLPQGLPQSVPQGTSQSVPQCIPPPVTQGMLQSIPQDRRLSMRQEIRQHMPQMTPQAVSRGMPLAIPQGVSPNIYQAPVIARQGIISSIPEISGFTNNHGYVYQRPPGLYSHYRLPGHVLNDHNHNISAPSEMIRPYYSLVSPMSQTMRYYPHEYGQVMHHNFETPEVSNWPDSNGPHFYHFVTQFPCKYQSSVFSGSNLLSPNENIQQNNMTHIPLMSTMSPLRPPMYQFQDVPENTNAMLETPTPNNYVPLPIDLNPGAGGFAPWSPANRQNSPNNIYLFDHFSDALNDIANPLINNNNITDDNRAVGSNWNCRCNNTHPEHENSDEDHATAGSSRNNQSDLVSEEENNGEDNKAVGSNRNSRANFRSEDEELEEELVALEQYLTTEYKLGD